MVARYYEAPLGRFLAVDPGDDTDPEDPQSWNKYAYVRNNPILKNDPTGNCGQMNPNNSGECRINPDPDGDGKNNITFVYNVAGAASPDQFVTVATANMVESAVVNSGVDSVNISSTTGR